MMGTRISTPVPFFKGIDDNFSLVSVWLRTEPSMSHTMHPINVIHYPVLITEYIMLF